MQKNKWWLLQLFADGGDGAAAADGGAAETGENDTAAGYQRLRELGVPESKIRKNKAYKASGSARTAATAEQTEVVENEPEQVATATPTEGKRMTWDEIKADPEYSKEMQNMVQQRLRKSKAAEENLSKLTPALEKLAMGYGLDAANFTHDQLVDAIMNDKSQYRDRALEMGVDEEVVEKLDRFDLMEAKRKQQEADSVRDRALREHHEKLKTQGEALKAKYPSFDLEAELANPTFLRMTAPGVGLSVEDAYYAVHRKEIEAAALKAAADRTAENIANAVRSGTMRPRENGTGAAAPSVTSFSYKNASQEQRNALKQRIRQAGARGEKVYPGQF